MQNTLVLEDGTTLTGESFGVQAPVAGEVVFNTAMSGYVETLTDPSYRGQILVCTYPLIGNYGVPEQRPPDSIDPPYESSQIQIQGLVTQRYTDIHSHHASQRSLGNWLHSEGVPAVTGIDTRTLTRRLREFGTMHGWLFPTSMSLADAKSQAIRVDMREDVFRLVAPTTAVNAGAGDLRILLIDIGAKDNIVRSLLNRGATVVRVPWHDDLKAHSENVDGVLIGNGPGDPADLMPLVEQVRDLLEHTRKIPVMGICLGNQILALAAGASTYKLPYGHRGVNQPVQDLISRKCFITSQNHGYAVKDDSLPAGWEPWFANVNDGTNEGIRSRSGPYVGVQFHPEARPGPEDTAFIFDEFIALCEARRPRK